ncbi:MAG TPA: TetR/AcrR family transcriptional regulator [Gryllotalpicola sp.]
MAPRSTTLRADAQQNRNTIVLAAAEALTGSPDVSMNAIAKRAGVGNATLHRNFPSREALVLAVYRREVDRLADSVDELLADQGAEDALRTWVELLAQSAMTKQGLGGALQAAAYSEDENFAEIYMLIVGALTVLLRAAERAGAVEPGTDPHDVLLALAGLWQLSPSGDWRAQARRLYEIVLRGIRPR